MALTLKIVSEHKEIVGDDAEREFSDVGGSIGRSLENDWILPDPDRYISGRHAVIDFKGGIYYLVDLSSNGVYVNDEHEPIGKGNPRRLFKGDRLRMGDFEIDVMLDKGESLVMPEEPDEHELPEDIEQLVPEVSLKTGVQLLDEEEITGDEEFQSALFGTTKLERTPTAKPKKEKSRPVKKKPVTKSTQVNVTSDDLFDSFLDGLGISRADLHSSVDAPEVMQNAGEVMKEFVEGISRLLISRAELKTAFRLDQTTVLPRHNNPLKLSENPVDSIKQLLVGREGEYLGPRDAVREVCRDLLFHQDAFLDAMSAAFVEFADRFDPDELVESFERSIGSKPLLGFLNKFKYWQLYCDLYPVMTEKGGGRFPHMFAEEFVMSYERQIAEFKRLSPMDSAQTVPTLEPLPEEDSKADLAKTINDARAGSFDDVINEKDDNPGDKKKPKDDYVDPYSTLRDSQRITPSAPNENVDRTTSEDDFDDENAADRAGG
ncbi:MAG: type VI secretion system-associated FHA domain protein TagH [Gammaproteobacteria bacterium]|nr:type VI secretion system-associated FHA domain protein TagH [Gammaproteobacteria bacterium]